MYFIKPTRSIPFLEQALEALPDLQVIHIDDLDLYDPTIIAIADVQDFLTHKWRLPTIVIAFEHEGSALAQAWEAGALAGWVWNQLPQDLNKALTRIDAQYKRNQDRIKPLYHLISNNHTSHLIDRRKVEKKFQLHNLINQ